jgi:hypothetical protein
MRPHIGRFATLLAMSAVLSAASTVNAQPGSIAQGDIVKARATLPVYSAPPHGAFYQKGTVLDSARVGDRLHVIDKTEVKTLGQSQVWLRVEPADGSGQRARRFDGWVYAGPAGGESNFLRDAQPAP